MWLFSIQQSVGNDEQLGRKLAIVFQEITRLENIVRSFLEFSRPPAMKLAAHDVGALIASTLDLFSQRAQQSGVHLLGPAANRLPPVLADPEQLKQVLVNLLSNAADVTPRGGEIRVTASCEPDPKGRRMVVVRVRDTGPGMPEDVRQRIFEPFYSTKDTGTGLGLCIAAAIVARHEGRLVLESAAPGGTSFAMWIPAAAQGPKITP
jgi:signal transduction histidine kinase